MLREGRGSEREWEDHGGGLAPESFVDREPAVATCTGIRKGLNKLLPVVDVDWRRQRLCKDYTA